MHGRMGMGRLPTKAHCGQGSLSTNAHCRKTLYRTQTGRRWSPVACKRLTHHPGRVRAASVAVADLRLIVGWIAATATTTT